MGIDYQRTTPYHQPYANNATRSLACMMHHLSDTRLMACTLALRLFGRIIGAVLIVIGLYFVLWGKSAEKNPTASARNLQDQLVQGGDMTTHLLDGGEAEASVKDEEAPATTDLLA